VVFLVALPLCLGVALASGAPLFSGLVAGIVGGIVVGSLSGSQLMVSGPAAGLTAIVLAAIGSLGSFQLFLVAVVLAGLMQIGLGVARAGIIGYYFPSSVIKGMLAAIGLILILKQLPHAVGYDADYQGDESFRQPNDENTFTALADALGRVQPGAAIISALSLLVLILWNRPALKRLKVVPAPLVVVLIGVGLNLLYTRVAPAFALGAEHLVQLPVPRSGGEFAALLTFPDWSGIVNPAVWVTAVTIAIVASLETLLSLEATDKMDPYKREAPPNRELLAQGVGNTLSGLVGGLPVTGVIVRSSANIDAGARTRWSAVTHGALLLVAVLAAGSLLNKIPLAALAAVLLSTGFKLAHPKLFAAAWRTGRRHFASFVITIVAILLTDLLVGIGIGLAVGLFFILLEQSRAPGFTDATPAGGVLRRLVLPEQVTFLHKASVAQTLESIPPGSRVEIDGRQARQLDHDVVELITDFRQTAKLRGIDLRVVGLPDTPTIPAHKH
jgi:SulP family sulfate permease